jgi:hypothetical protein
LDRREFLRLAVGAGAGFIAAPPRRSPVPAISPKAASQTSDKGGPNNTPKNDRHAALHQPTASDQVLEYCNPTLTEAVASILGQVTEAFLLIDKNIKANKAGCLNKEEAIYSNANKWASAIMALPIWALSLASRTLGDSITAGIELSKSDKSSLSTMVAYNAQTFYIIYIKNYLVEALRSSLIKRMESQNQLDPRKPEVTLAALENLYPDLEREFSKNLQSMNQSPESFIQASTFKKIFDVISILAGFLVLDHNGGLVRFLNSLARERMTGQNALKRVMDSDSSNYYKQAKIAVANIITWPCFNLINGICQELVENTITLDSSSELARLHLRELVGNLSSLCAYILFKAPMQNGLEHTMHQQKEGEEGLRTPFREIAHLMDPNT